MWRAWIYGGLLLSLLASPVAAAGRLALVVGNSDYRHVARLDNPANDARLVAETLTRLGFRLVGDGPQLNLDKARFDVVVQEFGRQLVGGEIGLFYYAGHGVQVRGSNYLVPVNANPTRETDVDFQMVDVNLLLRQMEGAGTRLNIVMLDACRNNPFGGRGLRASDGGLAQVRAPEGTLLSYATQPGNVALDGDNGHSPYTVALVDAMQRPGLDVLQAFNQVGVMVKNATGRSQQPWISSSPIDGTFYFAGPPGTQAAAVPPAQPIQPPAQPAPPPAARSQSDFIIPDSDRRQLTPAELQGYSKDQLRIARNEIFARRGRYFNTPDLVAYFSRFAWYVPSTWNPQLTAIEETNVRLLEQLESRSGQGPDFIFPDSDRRRITEAELAGLSRSQLRIAKNEIFARRGRFFDAPDLRSHFGRFAWYRPNTWNPVLTPIEEANVALIGRFER